MVALPDDCARIYRVVRELGRGGFGTVWLAEHKELGREVALKVLNTAMLDEDEQRVRFVDEARVTARLDDPHIVKVIDHGEGEVPWIAYEYLPGRSLRDILKSGPLPWREALGVAEQIAAGLEAAHDRGVLHRDIKSDNVLEAAKGHYKVADFGIARWSGSEVKTRTGFVMGTPTHMAPEVWQGAPVTAASEVYALGVVLFELLVGRLPFDGENLAEILNAHLKKAPDTPGRLQPDVPPECSELVKRALAKDPEERFGSMAQLRRAIARVRDPQTPGPPPGEAAGPAALPGSGVRSRPAGLGSGVATRPIGLGSGVATRQRHSRRLTGSQAVVVPVEPPAPGRARWVALAVGGAALVGMGLFAAWPSPQPRPSPSPSASPAASAVAPSASPSAAAPDVARLLEELRRGSEAGARAVGAARGTGPFDEGLEVGGVSADRLPDVTRFTIEAMEPMGRTLQQLDGAPGGPAWAVAAVQVLESVRVLDFLAPRQRPERIAGSLAVTRLLAGRASDDPFRRAFGQVISVRLKGIADLKALTDARLLEGAADATLRARRELVELPAGRWAGTPLDRAFVFARLAHLEGDLREKALRGYGMYVGVPPVLTAARAASVQHADELGRALAPWPRTSWEAELRSVLIDGVADAEKCLKSAPDTKPSAQMVEQTRRLWALLRTRLLTEFERKRLASRREKLSRWIPGLEQP